MAKKAENVPAQWPKQLLGALLLSLSLCGCGRGEPTPDAAQKTRGLSFTPQQASNAFDRVAKLIDQCTPRDAGTPGGARAAEWIQRQLEAMDVAAEIDRFTEDTPRGPREFRNVLATIPGEGAEWIILLSHFDTMSGIGETFQGANDSGSSTGLLLELAGLLQAQWKKPGRPGIICGFMDGEECMVAYSANDGFHGSRHFARKMKEKGAVIKAVICMDMIGDRDLMITIPRNGTAALRRLALDAAAEIGLRHKISLFDGYIYDDHQAFLDQGFPAVNLIDFLYGSQPGANDYWHTMQDTLDKISADSLLVTGGIVLEMLNRL